MVPRFLRGSFILGLYLDKGVFFEGAIFDQERSPKFTFKKIPVTTKVLDPGPTTFSTDNLKLTMILTVI